MREFTICLLLCLAHGAWGETTWPRFRGHHGNGLSSSQLPTKLSKETLVWSSKLPGSGSSSPVIWGKKVFLTTENRDRQSISLVCLDALSGKLLWESPLKVGAYRLHRFNNTAASTPALSKDRVVVAWFDGEKASAMLTGFDHEGKKLWDSPMGSFKSQHGFCLNPVIHDQDVIVAPLHMGEGSVASISLETGKTNWKKTYPGGGKKTSYITPLILEQDWGSEIVLASHSHGVWALDAKNGRERWSLPESMNHRTIVSPFNLLSGEGKEKLIGAGCKNGTYVAVRPPQKAGGQAEIAWRMEGKTPYVPTPVSYEGTFYSLSDGGDLIAIEAKSGKTRWTKNLRANFYASPLMARNMLYAQTREGELIIANLDKGYTEISRNTLNPNPGVSHTDATPAIAHDRLFLRVGDRLDCHGSK
jgi:hypothetical protein